MKSPDFFRETPPAPEREKKKLLNVFEDADAAFNALLEVEKESEAPAADDPRRLSALRGNFSSAIESAQDRKREIPEGKIESVGGFQGFSGGNRYSLFNDGVLKLSVAHSIEECIKKANEVGILARRRDPVTDKEPCPCGNGKSYGQCAHRF